jgi:hypothetical protein
MTPQSLPPIPSTIQPDKKKKYHTDNDSEEKISPSISTTFISPQPALKLTEDSNTPTTRRDAKGCAWAEPILLGIPPGRAIPGVRKHRFIYAFMI